MNCQQTLGVLSRVTAINFFADGSLMVLYCLVVFIVSWSFTRGLRHYALHKNMLDVPNHRSSHSVPTPRGGGLAFVFSFSLGLYFLMLTMHLPSARCFSLLLSGGLLALIGWLDDKASLPVRWRLLGQIMAVAIAFFGAGDSISLAIYPGLYIPSPLLNGIALFYLLWLLNLYNFMDGIDGLASLEAVSVCIGVAILYWINGHSSGVGLPLLLAAATGGFMLWNLPPARIFMGDVGSGYLGLMLGMFSILSLHESLTFFFCWLILLGVFIVDATVTLLRRLFRGEKVYQAHRSHAYQHATQLYNSHRRVTLVIFLINLVWLFPLALLVSLNYINALVGLLLAYSPLVILAIRFNAGKSLSDCV